MEDSQKVLEQSILNASPEIRKSLSDGSWAEMVDEVVKRNSLTEEQKTSLENEIVFVLLGMELASNFRANIEKNVGVPWNISMSINDKITPKVFAPLKQFLPTEEEAPEPNAEPTLKSIPEIAPIKETPLAPTVIAETHTNLPMIIEKPKTNLTFEERKKLVPNIPDNKVHYDGGKDPYREHI